MTTATFPSPEAAWNFHEEARRRGYEVRIPDLARPVTGAALWVALIGALIGGSLFGLIGALAEAGFVGLPRLEPLFAAPLGGVVTLLAVFGGSLGALVGGLVALKPAAGNEAPEGQVKVGGDSDEELRKLVTRYGGRLGAPVAGSGGNKHEAEPSGLTVGRFIAWLIAMGTTAVLLTALSYIWFLSMNYGNGSDQQSRLGYTLKNVQRIPADSPEEVATAMVEMYGGETLAVTANPVQAAVWAPVAAAQGRVLAYGQGASVPSDLAAARLELVAASPVVVIIDPAQPAHALPAAYTAAQFRAPVVSYREVAGVLRGAQDKLILVAGPPAHIGNEIMEALSEYGEVERVGSANLYSHALAWARGRWGNFGWGFNERVQKDGYYNFTLANPEDPAFAAAGLPMAYLGNYGPLLYTPRDDLEELTDQYLWRLGSDYFIAPSDGPFMNLRVVGGPESVSYNAQARPDLGVEIHAYKNQAQGLSGMAVLGWSWIFIGLAGFVWALFAMPLRLPESGFYPRVYWPVAMLVLGPLGIAAFFMSYQGRPIDASGHMPRLLRPAWASAVSATIMGMGIGMALMIAAMYLFELNGLPLWNALEFTPFFWLGSPMAAWMWVLMVVPAILLSTLFFMGPMMSDMHGVSYFHGVRKAAPVVFWSMVSASLGMWTLSWWWMNWQGLMANEDLWLWVTPLWWAAAMGFLTALIPNYLMVKNGWKEGGM